MNRFAPAFLLFAVLAFCSAGHSEQIFAEDFEGGSGTTLPAGWTNVAYTAGGNQGVFRVDTGHNGTGGSGGNGWHVQHPAGMPGPVLGGFILAPGAVSGGHAFTLTFDFNLLTFGGSADDAGLLIGDLSDPYGLDGSAINEYTMVIFNEGAASNELFSVTEGVRNLQVNDFAGTSGLLHGTWYRAEVQFTPGTAGGPGSLTVTVRLASTNAQRLSFTTPVAVGANVQFGFGTVNDQARFDNIVLNATLPINEVHPVADNIEVGVKGNMGFDATANDTTTFGSIDPSTITILSQPSAGTAAVDPLTHRIVYRHTGNVAGADSFQYQVVNTAGATGTGTVQVAISGEMRLANHTVGLPLTPPAAGALQMVDALPGVTFSNAVSMTTVPGSPKSLLVGSIDGRIWLIPDTTAASPRKLELFSVASRSNFTRGRSIYAIVCHPNFATNGQIIVNYQGDLDGLPALADIPNRDNKLGITKVECTLRIARFTVTPAQWNTTVTSSNSTELANTRAAILNSEYRYLNLAEQHLYHSINDCHFGPDGYLYVSFGDEGDQGEPFYNAQSITRDQFSSIIRIDLERKVGNLEPNPHYSIVTDGGVARFKVPADNPYVGPNPIYNSVPIPAADISKVRTEIYATGFRNPFKFHIDQPTGDLWVGDVGMDRWEEVSVIQKGDNAGWSFWEGNEERTNISHRKTPSPHKPPLWSYFHSLGNNSVTGGILYRGDRYSGLLDNKYLFGDFGSSRIWALTQSATPGGVPTVQELPSGGLSGIVCFAVDAFTDEVLLLQHTASGRVMRLIEAPPVNDPFPQLLSQTGAFADLATLEPNPGVVPYEPNLKFWSDNAGKARWFVIKNTTDKMTYSRNSAWSFPAGMIFIKHFDMELNRDFPATARKRLETRFLVRNSSGSYGVAYRWNAEGTEATLVGTGGVDFNLPIRQGGTLQCGQVTGGNIINQQWHIPSRSECLNCHNPAAGHALSVSTQQLNRDGQLGTGTGNYLTLLAQSGYLAGLNDNPAEVQRFYKPGDESASLDDRVRSYIAVNCSYCHQPSGGGNDTWDGRGHLTFEEMGILYGHPVSESYHDANDRFVIPGNKVDSLIYNRIHARGAIGDGTHNGYSQMPPLATNVVDDEGVQLLARWIDTFVNTAPAFRATSPTQAAIPETAPVGTVLASVQADDLDSRAGVADGANIRFAITSGNPNQLFAIHPATGEVVVNGMLDFVRSPQHQLQITASDEFAANPKATAQVLTVNLLDEGQSATADENENGIPELWETAFGLVSGDPGVDTDLDGIPDFFEFLSGGNPQVPEQGGTALVIAKGVVTEPQLGVLYEWRCRNGMIFGSDYSAETSASLDGWSILESGDYEVISVLPDGPGFSRITILVPGDAGHGFFRLVAPVIVPE